MAVTNTKLFGLLLRSWSVGENQLTSLDILMHLFNALLAASIAFGGIKADNGPLGLGRSLPL